MGKRTEYMRAYYEANKERIKAYNREYARQHKQRKNELAKAWAKAHPLEVSDINRRRYLKHREERLAYQKAYNARKKGAVSE